MRRSPYQSVSPGRAQTPRAAPPLIASKQGRSTGQPLETAVRSAIESRFGHDFSKVRVHSDPEAARSAQAIGARAFTLGDDIVFGGGEYRPDLKKGQELLVHELAHVVQQERAGVTLDAETRADRAVAVIMGGGSVGRNELGGAPIGAQAKPEEPGKSGPESAPATAEGTGGPAAPAASATALDGFVRDQATLTKKHLEAIGQLAFSIWTHLSLYVDATAAIDISGHTDTTGSEKHNSGLGTRRADNVKIALEAALQKQGVDSMRLEPIATMSFGETRLRVPTGDEVDAPANRRVEIEVTIKVKPPPNAAPTTKPLPGTPGGPKIWEVPGIMEELDPPRAPRAPRAPKSKGEWLEEALKRDPLLKKLPKWAREKAIGALKDADEKAADAIIDAIPFDDEYKQAAKAAMKALLQTLKGRKFKPPPSPPTGLPEGEAPPSFPKAPGEMIFKLPPIRF